MNILLQPNEYLITSHDQFLNKVNELTSNGYFFDGNMQELLLDVANYWSKDLIEYERNIPIGGLVDIIFIQVHEENNTFIVCTKRYRR